MTGSWSSPAAQADFKALPAGTTAGPQDVNAIGVTPPGGGGQPGAAGSGANEGSYAISYLLQTGLTKYAPMQPKPGTKITATNTSPLNPSFAWTVATTFLPVPSQVTTSTQAPTYSGTSIENTVSLFLLSFFFLGGGGIRCRVCTAVVKPGEGGESKLTNGLRLLGGGCGKADGRYAEVLESVEGLREIRGFVWSYTRRGLWIGSC